MGDLRRTALAALAASLGAIWAAAPSPAPAAAETAAKKAAVAAPATKKPASASAKKTAAKPKKKPARAAPAISEPAQEMADWVVASGDNRGLPFAVIDKVAAQVAVFAPDGKRLGLTPALVGLASGDQSTPGIGDREMSDISPDERTTPAGRFLAGYGPADGKKKVLWVDYATAISLHAVVTAHPAERRPQRLRSPTPDDNRITYGCINVPAAFYQNVVLKVFKTNGVVYILPEQEPMSEAFPAFQVVQAKPAEAPTSELAAAADNDAAKVSSAPADDAANVAKAPGGDSAKDASGSDVAHSSNHGVALAR